MEVSMTKKSFELTSDTISRLKLMSGVIEGGFLKRNIHVKNGSQTSLTLQTELKDIPDDCQLGIASFASLLGICNLFKDGVRVDYSDYDENSNKMFKILEKGKDAASFNFIVADEDYIETLNGELPEDVEFSNDSEFNEFKLMPEQISFLFSAGANIDADCLEFIFDNDEVKIELFNTTVSNSHRFIQKVDGADIAHNNPLPIDFAGAFKKLNPSIEYTVKIYENEVAEFENKIENIRFVMTKLSDF